MSIDPYGFDRADYEPDFDDDGYDDDEMDDGFECGAWTNGKFDFYSCRLAGTEDCDWECPYSAGARGLRGGKDPNP